MLKLNHDKIINIIEEQKGLELWLVGSTLHQTWQPRDIDFVVIGFEDNFQKVQDELLKLEYEIPHSIAFLNIENMKDSIRYPMKDFILLNALSNNSKLLSKSEFNLKPSKIADEELHFGRLFHLVIALDQWNKNGKLSFSLDTVQVNALSLLVEDPSCTRTKQTILDFVEQTKRDELIDYDSIFEFARNNYEDILNYKLEPLKIEELDLATILLIKHQYIDWLKFKADLNIPIKSFIKLFFQA